LTFLKQYELSKQIYIYICILLLFSYSYLTKVQDTAKNIIIFVFIKCLNIMINYYNGNRNKCESETML